MPCVHSFLTPTAPQMSSLMDARSCILKAMLQAQAQLPVLMLLGSSALGPVQ